METFPKVIEDIIIDYKNQIEEIEYNNFQKDMNKKIKLVQKLILLLIIYILCPLWLQLIIFILRLKYQDNK